MADTPDHGSDDLGPDPSGDPGADLGGIVPPGADLPVDEQDVPGSRPRSIGTMAAPVLPAVPGEPVSAPAAPGHWQEIAATGPVPAGYRTAGGSAVHPVPHRDTWGVVAAVVGAVGIVQAAVIRLPAVSLIAIILGSAGLRYRRLASKDSLAWTNASIVGVALGVTGLALGLALRWITGEWTVLDVTGS